MSVLPPRSKLPLLFPKPLALGDTLGFFTPSSPAYDYNEGLFSNGVKTLENMGFKVKLGSLTAKRSSQGYRSASAQERASEFMELIEDPNVKGLISTIGGSNSSSMIPFLDFESIRKQQKLICGYSDVTSLHLAILNYSSLSTVYGPAVMCWFGEWPNGCEQSKKWFLEAVLSTNKKRFVTKPEEWSNHKRNWENGDWKSIPRQWNKNTGWTVLNPGSFSGEILALNFNTLMSAAGTSYWPDLEGKLLLLEDMDAPFGRTERALRHLQYLGVFEVIKGLIIGKPEFHDSKEAPFSYEDLFLEVIGKRSYPIVGQFDCGHTLPMLSVPQRASVSLKCSEINNQVEFSFL